MKKKNNKSKKANEIKIWNKYIDKVSIKEPQMDVVTDPDKIDEALTRGVKDIFPKQKDLKKLLLSGKRIKLYTGIDPTANFLHVGHFIWMRKLAQFQKLGHQVIFLIGGFTAMIGDPDKQYTREPLTKQQVWNNFKDYKSTASKILNFDWKDNPITILNNYDWLSKVTLEDWLQIMGKITLQNILSHDMFRTRLKEEKPIRLHETMYPLMQGFDSTVMQVDLEVGGSDQTFNMLTGRTLSRELTNKNKFVLTLKLLTDTKGEKMGKTTGNAISSLDAPEDMYGKIMSWTDEKLLESFELLTNIDLNTVKKGIKSGKQMLLKKQLAFEIVKMLNDEEISRKAQEHFEKTVQKGETPDEMKEIKCKKELTALELVKELVKKGIIASNAEAKRLIKQGGIEIEGKKVKDFEQKIKLEKGNVVKVGKRKFVRIK